MKRGKQVIVGKGGLQMPNFDFLLVNQDVDLSVLDSFIGIDTADFDDKEPVTVFVLPF